MNKKFLIDDLSEKRNISKKDATEIVEDIFSFIKSSLKENEKFEYNGFGKFMLKHVGPQVRRNPRTGESVNVPAKNVVKFKVSKILNEEYN